MDLQINAFLLGSILVPLLAGLFKSEIIGIYQTWALYNVRPFDEDRNPNTPDRCQLHSAATGQWSDITIEKYCFSLNKNKAGVYIRHLLPDNKTAAEQISFEAWAGMRKRKMPE
ncbi:hypothetical protein [Prochlorothrix hollandica]|uniref:hypothetical protein n=1 Tax=Prochlorothrix hollandica TaxID=1223 RepID=UPI00334219D8